MCSLEGFFLLMVNKKTDSQRENASYLIIFIRSAFMNTVGPILLRFGPSCLEPCKASLVTPPPMQPPGPICSHWQLLVRGSLWATKVVGVMMTPNACDYNIKAPWEAIGSCWHHECLVQMYSIFLSSIKACSWIPRVSIPLVVDRVNAASKGGACQKKRPKWYIVKTGVSTTRPGLNERPDSMTIKVASTRGPAPHLFGAILCLNWVCLMCNSFGHLNMFFFLTRDYHGFEI
jgi:hypothetical protein